MGGTPALIRNIADKVRCVPLIDTIAQKDHKLGVANNVCQSSSGFVYDLVKGLQIASGGVFAGASSPLPKRYGSAKIAIHVKGTWAIAQIAQKFYVAAILRHASASGAAFAAPTAKTPALPTNIGTVLATASGQKHYVFEYPVQIDLLNRYIKLHIGVYATVSTSGAKLDIRSAQLILGGPDQTPASASGRG